MRLTNVDAMQLEEFPGTIIAPYAILSHTWGEGEISFYAMSLPDVSAKRGYTKINQGCILAQEAINPMFRWYEESNENRMPKYKWFTRGWTLQELIAPNIVFFYDADWRRRGNKTSLKSLISNITGIHEMVP
ncbi:hypothetical protein G7Y89_g15532 [Cudoniella acicularis]|uniref:Heterokaryon incompatibility domain-containing protein n=1 Tax=Cudoniella acicularis TaxID=354080 RepID=A0A8H4QL49_9HELO|nr:hypothetical protein G7Y89_g15532 [Cudoniella acicularis]